MKELQPKFPEPEIAAVMGFFNALESNPDRKAGFNVIEGVHPALGDFAQTFALKEIPNADWLKNALKEGVTSRAESPQGFGFYFYGSKDTAPTNANEAEGAINLLKTLKETKRHYIKLGWSSYHRWEEAEELGKKTRIRIGEKIYSPDYYVYEVLFDGYEEYEKELTPEQSDLVLQGFREAMTDPKTDSIGFRIIHSDDREGNAS